MGEAAPERGCWSMGSCLAVTYGWAPHTEEKAFRGRSIMNCLGHGKQGSVGPLMDNVKQGAGCELETGKGRTRSKEGTEIPGEWAGAPGTGWTQDLWRLPALREGRERE